MGWSPPFVSLGAGEHSPKFTPPYVPPLSCLRRELEEGKKKKKEEEGIGLRGGHYLPKAADHTLVFHGEILVTGLSCWLTIPV